ncbi:MAG: MFS transporter [Candidatus Abyssobacteria bacterium SURF_5]|uniref:MFS transporter n=1 Tax=Abyssobacteria bacterium (strain SURF_5) TaxID=2093360 RepID=A0A3A4NCR9_ABYX5|nr:MAG: MFS transporter [Candidatus Abyssubacteria bacterium SURF_5]
MNPQKISLSTMFILGAGWFGSNFFWAFYGGPMPLFLKNFSESKFSISLVLGFAGLASCIMPPIVGHVSDRTWTRFGRRKPFVVFGVSGVLLCLFVIPHLQTFASVAVLSAILYLVIACAETPLFSLLPDITPVEQRSTTSGIVHLLGSVGLIIFFAISSRLWDVHPVAVFRMVGIVTFTAMLTVVLLIKEPATIESTQKQTSGISSYLSGIIQETEAMKYYSAQFFWWLGFYMVSTFITLFAVEELGVTEGDSMFLPMALTVVTTLSMYPLGVLGDHVGRKKLLTAMIALWGVLGLFIGFSRTLPQAVILVGLTGLPFATVLGVGYAYMLDLIPPERTAEFVGFSIFSISLPMVLGAILAGTFIDIFGFRLLFPIGSLAMFVGLIILQFTSPRAALLTPQERPD